MGCWIEGNKGKGKCTCLHGHDVKDSPCLECEAEEKREKVSRISEIQKWAEENSPIVLPFSNEEVEEYILQCNSESLSYTGKGISQKRIFEIKNGAKISGNTVQEFLFSIRAKKISDWHLYCDQIKINF